MAETWSRRRPAAADATRSLLALLEDSSVDDARLVKGYLDAKRQLAQALQALLLEKYGNPTPLNIVKDQLEQHSLTLYPDLPGRYRVVRGFGRVHEHLFAYLVSRVGEKVGADELRILTGDAVHTERRARDLRDLGLDVVATDSGGAATYVLTASSPRLDVGARAVAARNIASDKTLSEAQRANLNEMLDPTQERYL